MANPLEMFKDWVTKTRYCTSAIGRLWGLTHWPKPNDALVYKIGPKGQFV